MVRRWSLWNLESSTEAQEDENWSRSYNIWLKVTPKREKKKKTGKKPKKKVSRTENERFTSAQKQEGKPCRGLSMWKLRAPGREKALNLQTQGVWDESGAGPPTANMLLQDHGATEYCSRNTVNGILFTTWTSKPGRLFLKNKQHCTLDLGLETVWDNFLFFMK